MAWVPFRKILLEVLAVPKNSLYLDPAVANAGWTAGKFDEVSSKDQIGSEVTARYLTWRCSYLVCAIVFTTLQLALSWKSYEGSKLEYEGYLRQLGLGTEKFDPLVTGLAMYEFTVWMLSFPALLLVAAAAITASPCLAISWTRLSRRLVWCAWLVSFLPPFLLALIFPMRSLLPWAEVLQEVCAGSIKATFDMPGSTLASAMAILADQGVIAEMDVLMSPEEEELQAWCSTQGDAWHEAFYDVTLQCIWDVDAECRSTICTSAPADHLLECLGDCLTWALERDNSTKETVHMYRGTYDKCVRAGGPKKAAPGSSSSGSSSGPVSNSSAEPAPTAQPTQEQNQQPGSSAQSTQEENRQSTSLAQSVLEQSGVPDDASQATLEQIRQAIEGLEPNASLLNSSLLPVPEQKDPTETAERAFERNQELQQMLIVESSKAATLVALQSEYVVGTLVGAVLGRTLLTSSLGLLGGVSKALANVKAMFPNAQAPGWILILTTSEAVPIYAGLLGVFNQTVGDSVLAIACTLAAVYVGLGTYTGWRMNQRKSGHEERQKLCRLVCCEYAMRLLVGAGIIICFIFWMQDKDLGGMQDYLKSIILTPSVLLALVFQFFANKVMTTIASMDAVLAAFVQSELWQTTHLAGDARNAHLAALNDLRRLFTKPSRVTPMAPSMR